MTDKQLKDLRVTFDLYTKTFYSGDHFVNENIELKARHSKRVSAEIFFLADQLKLYQQDKNLAACIGLYHDIGRFEQFRKYRTFMDRKSENHAGLGVKVCSKENFFHELTEEDINIIEKSILFHNRAYLPENMEKRTKLFTRMIRDADKLDIFKVVTEYYEKIEKNDNEAIGLDLPHLPYYSHEVFKRVINQEMIPFGIMRTLNDFKLVQMSWVYDLNYQSSKNKVLRNKYIERIAKTLPQNNELKLLVKKLLQDIRF